MTSNSELAELIPHASVVQKLSVELCNITKEKSGFGVMPPPLKQLPVKHCKLQPLSFVVSINWTVRVLIH